MEVGWTPSRIGETAFFSACFVHIETHEGTSPEGNISVPLLSLSFSRMLRPRPVNPYPYATR
eukprot:2303587-Pyramimonas_sp.AAC.1